ncbi:hypothetical protein ACIBF7_43905 [Nonomuraea sp. NPDC050478]|uniref:hypothetical protein n=1 Tax=Nonomuraea sp. NPDC050478 TaxID=3364365 RepID=UPI0037A25A9E
MSITVLLEILAGILLIFCALISAAALWVPPRRSHAAIRRRAASRTQSVEDRPDWPGKGHLPRTPSPATPPKRPPGTHQQRDAKLEHPAATLRRGGLKGFDKSMPVIRRAAVTTPRRATRSRPPGQTPSRTYGVSSTDSGTSTTNAPRYFGREPGQMGAASVECRRDAVHLDQRRLSSRTRPPSAASCSSQPVDGPGAARSSAPTTWINERHVG